MLTQLSIGQQVRIINYDHPHCGEFVNVRSVHADGQAAMGVLLRFPGRWTSFTIEQVCLASPSRPILKSERTGYDSDPSYLPEVSRASHYSS